MLHLEFTKHSLIPLDLFNQLISALQLFIPEILVAQPQLNAVDQFVLAVFLL